MDVNAIDTPDVETVLMQPTENDHPFWLDKHVIAYRLKGYIEEVLGYGEAVAQAGVQCGVWKDNLVHLLPTRRRSTSPSRTRAALQRDRPTSSGSARDGRPGVQCLDALITGGVRSNEESSLTGRRSTSIARFGRSLAAGRSGAPSHLSRQALALFQSLPRTGDLVSR